jgi:hypothetical protein
MAEKGQFEGPQVTLDASKSVDIVAIASRAQSDKVRAVLERIDTLSRLDKNQMENITSTLAAAAADGGCGIGCW